MSGKIYGVIRMGIMLDEEMSEKATVNIFIDRGLRGKTYTSYKHSVYRPMLYVDIEEVCKAFERFGIKILDGEFKKSGNSLEHIKNMSIKAFEKAKNILVTVC